MPRDEDELRPDHAPVQNEQLVREGGVLAEPNNGRDVGHEAQERGSTQDDVEQDVYDSKGRPGTVDDVPFSLGTIEDSPNDQHLVFEGGTKQAGTPAPDEEPERDIARGEERDLWRRERALIEEDVENGVRMPADVDEETARRIMDAMGDEVSEPLPDWPDGTAATADVEPEHGGFPERKD